MKPPNQKYSFSAIWRIRGSHRPLVYDELLAIARAVHRVLISGTKACAGRGQERPSG